MKNKRKGFTLVELLAVLVIVASLAVIAIVGVNRYIDGARKTKVDQERDNIAMAARLYLQANTELLPRSLGDSVTVQVSELRRTNYLKEDVKDKKGNSCMDNSFVRVYKLDEQEYSYNTHLYCGDEIVPDDVTPPNPVMVSFKFNGYGSGEAYSNVKNATFTFKIKAAESDSTIGLYSYSYSIFAKKSEDGGFTEVFNSGDLKAGLEPSVEMTSKALASYFDVTGYNAIRVTVTAINEQGGKLVYTSSGDFKDTDSPACGLITGQATSDEDWVNKAIFNSGTYKNNFRRISVACSDGDGSGCKRETFTTSWPNDTDNSVSGIDYSYGARWSYITLEDNAQTTNKTTCYVRANVDVRAPKVIVSIYKAKQDGSRGAKVGTITVDDDGKRTSTLPEGTLQAKDFTDVTGTSSEKWMNKANFPYGVILDVDIEDNLYLYSYEWQLNNPYVEGGTKNDTIMSTASTTNSTAEQAGGTAVSGYFESTGMTDNPKNDNQLKTAEHGALEGHVKGLLITREGKRYGKLIICDKAGNCTTVHIFANLDRTAPLVPVTSYAKLTSNTAYTAATVNDYLETTKWSNEYIRSYIEGQREDKQTQNTNVKASLSGWDHFEYSYYQQKGKNGTTLTWKAAKTDTIYNPFSGTTRYGFDIKDQGTHKVKYLSCDKAGNCSEYSTDDYVKVDTVKPTCTIHTDYHGTTGPNDAGWLKIGESVTLSHDCEDKDTTFSSGCNSTDYHNQQSYLFEKDIDTKKAGANGYETTYGANDNTAGGHVVDYAGNMSDECPKMTLKIDHLPPNCETVISYPQGDPLNPTDSSKKETGWLGLVDGTGTNKKTAVVSLKCTDVKSTTANGHMANVNSKCNNDHADNKASFTYNTEMSISNAGAKGAGQGGQVRDIAGNITQCPADRTVKIDYTVPVCQTNIDCGVQLPEPDPNYHQPACSEALSAAGWLGLDSNDNKELARVSQVCTDPNGTQKSGCDGNIKSKTYNYEINTNQAGAIGVGDNGFVTDKAGNKGDCNKNGNFHTVKIDYKKPVCKVTVTSKGSGNGNNWNSSNYTGGWLGKGATVTITSTCDNAENGTGVSSGCATNESKDYKSEINTTLASTGGNNVDFYVYDKADNKSKNACTKKTVKIDLTGPKCTVSSTYGTNGTGSSYGGEWINGKNKVNVNSKCTSDPLSIGGEGSGCSETDTHTKTYSVEEGKVLVTTGGSASNGGGYVIKDNVGNETTCGKQSIQLDYQPPLCPVIAKKEGGASYSSGSWVNGPVTISRSCNDRGGSGCSPYMRINSDVPVGAPGNSCGVGSDQLTNSHVYDVAAPHVAEFSGAGADGVGCTVYVQDNVGNSTLCQAPFSVLIDKAPPECTVSTTYRGGWTNQNVVIQGACTDTGSGCKTTANDLKETINYNFNGNFNYSKPLEDNAGNTSTCTDGPYSVKVQKSGPSCRVEKLESTRFREEGVNYALYCSNATGDSRSANLAVCDTVEIVNGDHWTASRGYREQKESHTYMVEDTAGNISYCSVTINRTAQNKHATCSAGCNTCTNAGCMTYTYCKHTDCGTESYTCKKCCPRNYVSGGVIYRASCDSSNYNECGTATCYRTASCRTAKCGCDEYYASCATCGCSGTLTYSADWYNGDHYPGWDGSTHYLHRYIYD